MRSRLTRATSSVSWRDNASWSHSPIPVWQAETARWRWAAAASLASEAVSLDTSHDALPSRHEATLRS